ENAKKDQMLFNDDIGPDDLNSRVVFIPPAKDAYRLVVTSFDPGEKGCGRYTLTIQKAAKVGPPIVTKDALDEKDPKHDGRPFKMHKIKLTGGGAYTIDLESKAFTPLVLMGTLTAKNQFPFNGLMPRFKTGVRFDFTPKADGEFTFNVLPARPGET